MVAIENHQRSIYALQYHPEVQHSVRGNEVIKHFLFDISKLSKDWRMDTVLDEELEKVRSAVSLIIFACDR